MLPEKDPTLLNGIREAEVVSLCQDLVRFKSVNPRGTSLRLRGTWATSFAKRV
jgi:hypothetical protein